MKVIGFDVFPFWNFGNVNQEHMALDKREIKKKKKRKKRAVKRTNTSLKNFLQELKGNSRHSMLSFLSCLSISLLRVLKTEANKFYDRNHPLYDAALLTRCYTQHALRPFIDTETNRKGIS